MSTGKSKRVARKGRARRQIEPFSRKQWFDVKAPFPFEGKAFCKTPINKSAGTRIASEVLKGRVFEISAGDLTGNQSVAHTMLKLRVDDVRGKNAFTSFHGMRLTTDKVRSLLKKWHTTIKTQADVRTADGYTLRMFVISFTKRRQLQIKKTTYAKHSHVLKIVARMRGIMAKTAAESEMKDLTNALVNNTIGSTMEKACSSIFPLENTHIWKVKVLKRPKVDPAKLSTLYKDFTTEVVEEAVPEVEEAAEE